MLKNKLSFDEVQNDSNFKLMSKQRLSIVKKDVFEQLENHF
jgi:hypothetical protein